MVATKTGGKYYMYWGDTDIFLSTSDNLINWTVTDDYSGKTKKIFGPRS